MVSIPFKREGTGEPTAFVYIKKRLGNTEKKFQFPSNGKARVNSPYFAPSRAVAPYTPKPNANCARLFFCENSGQKSDKPL